MEPCCWTSLYEPFTDPDQSPTDALHRPVPNVSSEAIVSGEAVYIDDMPASKGTNSVFITCLAVELISRIDRSGIVV